MTPTWSRSQPPALAPSLEEEVAAPVASFYRDALTLLNQEGIPFLVGGAFAHACYTDIRRSTKDLDLFILRNDYQVIERVMTRHSWRVELTYPHWLAKVYNGKEFIDLIFNSGNGLTPVDAQWFKGNARTEVLGVPVNLANVEDCLLSKAFIMERERYDGGDVAHMLLLNAHRIDWTRLLQSFGIHWRVLLAHLTLFGFIYPSDHHRIPREVILQLTQRLTQEILMPPAVELPVCAGTLLSREQYLHDVEKLGYVDGRLTSVSTMTAEDVQVWTQAIPPKSSL